MTASLCSFLFFFFNDTATTEIYTLSLHDALPIYRGAWRSAFRQRETRHPGRPTVVPGTARSEEHTSELQSLAYLVCRLLLEKKKKTNNSLCNRSHIISSTRFYCSFFQIYLSINFI